MGSDLQSPQTVLKTAALPSTAVHGGPLEFNRAPSDSRIVHLRPPLSVELAVFLAVSRLIHRGLLIPRFRVRLPARAPRRCVSSPPRRSGHAWSRDPQEARPEDGDSMINSELGSRTPTEVASSHSYRRSTRAPRRYAPRRQRSEHVA